MRDQAREKHTKKANAAGAWPKAKRKSAAKKDGGSGDATARIQKLMVEEQWSQAQPLLHRELLYDPSSHWLWLTLSSTYYEQLDYETALVCARRAVELAPWCSLALWHYAGALSMSYEEESALAVYSLILAKDPEEVAHGDCGEGMDWAMALMNDVHYNMGRLFEFLGKDEQARVSFDKYLANREHGVSSIYDADEVKNRLAKLKQTA